MRCRAEAQAIRIIKTMKLKIALANRDSISIIANSFCEDGKKEECIQQATDEAHKERLRIGKGLLGLYRPIVALILEAGRNVTDRLIPEPLAKQYLSERLIEASTIALQSNTDGSYNKPKNKAAGSQNLQKRNQNFQSEVGGRRKPARLVKRQAAVLFSSFKSFALGAVTYAASALYQLMLAAVQFVKYVLKQLGIFWQRPL